MTNPTQLSPAAQAVLDAFNREAKPEPHHQREAIAAALEAAADQVVPEWKTTPGGSKVWQGEPVPSIRAEFLAIATELENHAN